LFVCTEEIKSRHFSTAVQAIATKFGGQRTCPSPPKTTIFKTKDGGRPLFKNTDLEIVISL